MARCSWKSYFYALDSLKAAYIIKLGNKLKARSLIFKKSSNISNIFIGQKLNIYKGCFFRTIVITKFILGRKLGEFCFTRKPFKFKKKLKINKDLKR